MKMAMLEFLIPDDFAVVFICPEIIILFYWWKMKFSVTTTLESGKSAPNVLGHDS
jgi:hypothetical protein